MFVLNESEARKADVSGFAGRIEKSGAYIGHFDKVYEVLSGSSSSKAIRFSFISEQGQTAQFDIWHTGKTGDSVGFAVNLIQSCMGLMGLKDVRPKPNETINVYDFDMKSNVDKRVTSFPQLINRRIGIFITATENVYTDKNTGEFKSTKSPSLSLTRFFDTASGQTYTEKLDNAPAEAISKLIASTPDIKPHKDSSKVGTMLNAAKSEKSPIFSEEPFDDTSFPF